MTSVVYAAYFSPTCSTQRVTCEVADALASELGKPLRTIDFTPAGQLPANLVCDAGDVLVFGFPVYAGRVPQLLLDKIARFSGNGAEAVAVALFGNRDYDDALLEACDLLAERGFNVVAAGAFVGEHSMTRRVGTGRPNEDDLAIARQFGRDAAAKLAAGDTSMPAVKGNHPYKDHPAPADIRPLTTDACTGCGICVDACPLGLIDADDPTRVAAGCIRCNACVKSCPEGAKLFDAEPVNKVVAMLEAKFTEPKQPELFL